MSVIHITDENFEQEVLQSEQPVLVDFWGEGCGPCQMLAPVIEEVAAEVKGAKVGKVNVYEEQKLAEQYRIMSIPTLIVFQNGKAVREKMGIQRKATILEMLENISD